jgi:GT2 family glycosyltransferase
MRPQDEARRPDDMAQPPPEQTARQTAEQTVAQTTGQTTEQTAGRTTSRFESRQAAWQASLADRRGSWKGVVAGPHLARHLAGARSAPASDYDVDIIILALDRSEDTCAAIDSALAQRHVTRHVLVLDQGSRSDALKKLIAHVETRSDVTLLAAWRNLGVPGGRNLATAFGHGRIIAALDNDAEFATPDLLAQTASAFDADQTLGVVACRIVAHATGTDDFSSWGYPSRLLSRAGETFDTATFVGAGHAIRRTTWDAAGGYDEALFFCWEEFDFALRAISAGWRICYRGDLVIRHKVSGEHRVAWSDARWFQHVRNRLYIGRKYGDSWLSLSPRIAAYLVKGMRNGLLPQSVKAVAAAVRLGSACAVLRLPATARDYLRKTDAAHRGTWFDRVRNEVLATIPRKTASAAGAAHEMHEVHEVHERHETHAHDGSGTPDISLQPSSNLMPPLATPVLARATPIVSPATPLDRRLSVSVE